MSVQEAKDITDLRKLARELSILALHFSGGGSEMFKTVAGEPYADADECRKRADHRRDSVQQINDLNLITVLNRVVALESDEWLIWSNEHRAWWRPNSSGYTFNVEKAGRYMRDEALLICRQAGTRGKGFEPSEIPVRWSDAAACLLPAKPPPETPPPPVKLSPEQGET